MAKKYNKGQFVPKNSWKYVGVNKPIWRSSWELSFMNFCDNHPNIVQWASESLSIPYQHPFTGKWTLYIPDFIVYYIDKNKGTHVEVIEIKPLKETVEEKANSMYDQMSLAVNLAKWKAAATWCAKKGFTFRVMTEKDIYR